MKGVLAAVMSRGVVVTDGAWGTQLQARGLGSSDYPDAWNLSRPKEVESVARAYVEAGSQVILTNTFGSNRLRLAGHGLEGQVEGINRAGVEISRRAAGERAKVFASIGPSGKLLLAEEVSAEQLREAFGEQARFLAAAGADGLVVETMSDVEEALLAVEAAKATGLPVVACMVFDSGKDRDRTMTGVTPEQAVSALAGAGVDVVGANCGQGIDGFVSVCRRMRAVTALPLWMKANAGLPELVNGAVTYRTSPEEFAARVPDLCAAGAVFVGGCCGTHPEFIRRTTEVLAQNRRA